MRLAAFCIIFLLALGICRKKALFTFTAVFAGYAVYKVMLLVMAARLIGELV